MSRILMPEYLLDFARDIYEVPLPSNFGERLIESKYVQVLENWYKLFGGKIPGNQGKRMVPNYLLLFIQNLANAEILEVVDDDVAYIKETPQNALKYAYLNKVGGMSYKGEFEGIRESLVTSVNDTALTANEEKYGWGINEELYNYRDYDEDKGHVVVGRVDLGSLNWEYQSSNTRFRAVLNGVKKAADNDSIVNAICYLYDVLSWNGLYSATRGLSFIPSDNVENYVYIKDENYTDATTFKTAMSGVYLYYELATEQTEDIESIDNIIDVSNNLTFNNEYEQAVPSEITYYVRS